MFLETIGPFLFANTKVAKYVDEHVLAADALWDWREGINALADVLWDEFSRDVEGEAFLGAEEGSAGVGEGLDVALVCDQSGVAVAEEVALRLGENGSEISDSGAGFCWDREEFYDVFVVFCSLWTSWNSKICLINSVWFNALWINKRNNIVNSR